MYVAVQTVLLLMRPEKAKTFQLNFLKVIFYCLLKNDISQRIP